MNLRFHWMLPKAGEVALKTAPEAARYRLESRDDDSPSAVPDMDGWVRFARSAEEAGIDSVLISFSRYEPEPFLSACALGQATTKLKYIAAYRLGLMQPPSFIQQVNTLSALIGGRVSLNIVAGSSKAEQHGYGDFLDHDERYARAEEFLKICHAFWRGDASVDFDGTYYRVEGGQINTPFVAPDRMTPEIYVSGHSEAAIRLACNQGSCWLRVADTPEKLRPLVARARAGGVGVCLRMGIICRPTREEAIRAAEALLPYDGVGNQKRSPIVNNDSQMYREAETLANLDEGWLNRSLWTGLVPYYSPVWTTLMGTPEELAARFLEYKDIGVSEFILSGCPEVDEVETFGREVLPLVRAAEREQERHLV